MSVTNIPPAKFLLSFETVSRIEKIAETRVTRVADRILNNALDNLENKGVESS